MEAVEAAAAVAVVVGAAVVDKLAVAVAVDTATDSIEIRSSGGNNHGASDSKLWQQQW